MSLYNRLSEALKATATILGGGRMVQADEIEEATEQPKVEPSLARFLDVVTFLESLELATATLAPDSPLRSQALLLAKQTQPDFLIDASTYLEPLFGIRGLGKWKLKWKPLARTATNHDRFVARGTFLRNFIRDLAAKPQVFRDTFPDARLLTAARKLAQVSEAKTAPEALAILGSMRSLSGLVRLRNWNREAAAESGVQISEFDDVVAAVGEAQDLGHQLATTEAQLQSPQTASEAERLEVERDEIKSKIESVALTSPNAEAVLAVAAQAAQPRAYQTKTGEQLGLNPQQEDAMMVRGKAIIAAGAGSGKTRVLAGKVVYHVKELGVRPSQIIATSFSKKSGDELVERIRKYGGEAITEDSYALEGFGTTHSIALKLLKRALPRLKGRDTIIKDSGVKYLMKMAMQQVRMRPQQYTQPQPFDPNESFFAQRPVQAVEPEQQPEPVETAPQAPVAPQAPRGPGLQPVAPGGPADDATIKRLAQEALSRGRFSSWPLEFLTDMAKRGAGRRGGLSDKQKAALIRLLNQAGVDPTPISGAMLSVPMLLPQAQDAGTDVQAMPEGLDYFKVPANQWFNLGLGDDAFKDEKGRPLGPKQVGMYLTRWRADLMTPGQAAAQAQAAGMSLEIAAAYGAYEWLKHNHSDFAGKIDFDDMLIMACQQLVASPRLLAECQNRWKVVLVDEAQDLNRAQHLLFGLVAGYYDPSTQQPWPDGHMTADTFAFIGDDKQCVAVDTPISTRGGDSVVASSLTVGDSVLSYRNGKNALQMVTAIKESSWTWGYKVTTDTGHSLTMSPNHKLWASEPRTEGDQMAVYLMFRKDMGFRVGITNKGKVTKDEDANPASYGGRTQSERAERLWILDIVPSREDALLYEYKYSLQYGIPTMVFEGENRGLNQARINEVFATFGKNGGRLLEDKHLSFDHPHWMASSFTRNGKERRVVNFLAHSATGSQVLAEWSGDTLDQATRRFGVAHTNDGRRRLRRYFDNYRLGLKFAEEVTEAIDGVLAHKISLPEGTLREVTASGLFVGMKIPVLDENANALETITSIEKVEGKFLDLSVSDAANFYGGGILSHNSIYGFRGADVELFINKSNLVPQGAGFTTKLLDTNYRSGKAIVDAAGNLIKHNSKQIPMECKANEARKGAGFIHAKVVDNHEAGAAYVAEEIHDLVTSGAETYGEPKGVPTFGIGVRTNAESYAFAAECLKRGIPFKSKVNFFNDKTTKAILHWLVLASKPGDQNAVNEAVLEAHGAPRFFLDKVFEHKLQEKARGQSYLAYLEGGGWRTIYDGRMSWKNERNVLPYMKALRMVTDLGTQASPKEILEVILNIKGIGVGQQPPMSMIDTLIEDAKDDPELLDTIREETEGEPGLEGQITDDDVKALALAPIQPLMGLLEGYNDLGQAMLYVEKLKDANKKLAKGKKADDEDDEDANEPAVIIDTVHGWKGLEAKRMYVPMPSGTFPHAKSTTGDALAAERRLGYVAITRGQDRVTILAPLVNHQGKPSGPSVFVSEACIAVEGQVPTAPPSVPGAPEGTPPAPTVAAAIDFATMTLHEIAALLSAEQTAESILADEDQSAPEDLLLTDPNAEPEPEAEEEPTMDEVTEVASASLALSQDLLASLKEKP